MSQTMLEVLQGCHLNGMLRILSESGRSFAWLLAGNWWFNILWLLLCFPSQEYSFMVGLWTLRAGSLINSSGQLL